MIVLYVHNGIAFYKKISLNITTKTTRISYIFIISLFIYLIDIVVVYINQICVKHITLLYR